MSMGGTSAEAETYDAYGNRSSDPTYPTFSYDGENHLTSLGSGPALTNVYDADGQRLIRTVGGTITHFIGGMYEYDPIGQVATVYYPFGGAPVAMKKGSVLSYLHHDHLGSLVSATDASGSEQCSVRFWPFGAIRTSTGTLVTDRLYTGQTRDLANDAYYFYKARYYDATIGKFHTADTVVPGKGSPRGLNRYAYALSNPLRLVDPSGHDPMDPKWSTQFAAEHNGRQPTQQDWQAYEYSQTHPGTGPNGTWTPLDWFAVYVLLPLEQAQKWTFDRTYEDWVDNPSPVYLVHHAAQLLAGWANGKIVSVVAFQGLESLLASPFMRSTMVLEDRRGNPLLTSFRGLTSNQRTATIRLLSKLFGSIPFAGVDETTGATVASALAEFAGAAEMVGAALGAGIGAMVLFFATPETAESN